MDLNYWVLNGGAGFGHSRAHNLLPPTQLPQDPMSGHTLSTQFNDAATYLSNSPSLAKVSDTTKLEVHNHLFTPVSKA